MMHLYWSAPMRIGPLFGAVLVTLAFTARAQALDRPATKKTFQQEIGFQIKLMKKGDVKNLKFRFTKRQRGKITSKMIRRAVKKIGKYRIDDLVYKVVPGKHKNQLTAKIEMKNGRTLTTFLLVGGVWLADTLWFK